MIPTDTSKTINQKRKKLETEHSSLFQKIIFLYHIQFALINLHCTHSRKSQYRTMHLTAQINSSLHQNISVCLHMTVL